MSRFSGKYHAGAMSIVREQKRKDAKERDKRTPFERTKRARRWASPDPVSEGGIDLTRITSPDASSESGNVTDLPAGTP